MNKLMFFINILNDYALFFLISCIFRHTLIKKKYELYKLRIIKHIYVNEIVNFFDLSHLCNKILFIKSTS